MAEHGIELVQLLNAPLNLFDRDPEFLRQFTLLRVVVWQKFMERRIEKTDRRGQTF